MITFENVTKFYPPNTNALESNLLSGTIDAISPLGLPLDQALDFERRHGTKFAFHYRPSMTWEHIDCNLEDPILKDKRVRQALLYSANRQQIVDVLFQGKQQVADTWLPPKHYGYNPKVAHYNYDPDKAKKLLEEAGWVLSPSGVRVNKRGDKLHLTLMSTAGNKTREQVEQVLQSDWSKIGIELEIINQPPKVFFGETMRHRKYKQMALYAWVVGPVSDGEGLWTKENIPSEKNNWIFLFSIFSYLYKSIFLSFAKMKISMSLSFPASPLAALPKRMIFFQHCNKFIRNTRRQRDRRLGSYPYYINCFDGPDSR